MPAKLFPILWLCSLFPFLNLSAQDNPSAGDKWYQQAKKVYRTGQIDSALFYLESAKTAYAANDDHKGYANALSEESNMLYHKGDTPAAVDKLWESRRYAERLAVITPQFLSNFHSNLNMHQANLGQFEAAQRHLDTAYQLIQTFDLSDPDNIVRLAALEINYGRYLVRMHDYDAGHQLYEKAVARMEAAGLTDHRFLSNGYFNLGFSYIRMRDGERAAQYGAKSIELDSKLYGPKHPYVIDGYHSMGHCYELMGQTEQAKDYHRKAISLYQEVLGPGHEKIAELSNCLGDIARGEQAYDEALDLYQNALGIYEKLLGPNTERHLLQYSEILGTLLEKEDIAEAEHYFALALPLAERLSQSKSYNANDIFINRGYYFRLKGKHQAAVNSFLKVIQMYEPDYRLAQQMPSLIQIGKANALAVFQALGELAYSQSQHAAQSQGLAALDSSLQTFQQFAQFVDSLRITDFSADGLLFYADYSIRYFEKGIATALAAHQQKADHQYLEMAFAFSERAKAVILQKAQKEAKARSYAGIPADLLAQEQQLKSQLSFYEQLISSEEQKATKQDTLKIIAWRSKRFNLQNDYQALVQKLEQAYPLYYRIKYDLSLSSLADLQTNLASDQQLLSYFWGDSSVFVFKIQPQSVSLERLGEADALGSQIEDLRNQLIQPYISSAAQLLAPLDYAALAEALFVQIWPQSMETQIAETIIVPDGHLSYLPFELLITESDPSWDQWAALPYLVKSQALSYAFSATQWLNDKKPSAKPSPSKTLLAIAPQFGEAPSLWADANQRQNWGALRFSQQEASQVQQLWDGTLLAAEQATKAEFIKLAPAYRILHLSSHGKANDQDARYSFIAFAPEESESAHHLASDSVVQTRLAEEGASLLYTADLYGLQLNADLVVLSACETGLGELQRGEGLVSMARGFAYAGAKATLTSLWSVNDKATANLMLDFHKGLREGMPKNQAFRQAQLNMIESNHSPFYWGGFVMIGDTDALGTQIPWYWYLAGAIFFFGLIMSYFRFRKTRDS
ncbi:MAG: CHAT domain-containing tetratricopeptide repeat protein [Bacteroidota bacterium]